MVKRIAFIISISLIVGGCAISREQTFVAVKSDTVSPNILLIVVDDMGFSDLGAFGGEIHTPNLDQLALAGMRLTNFHAAASCSPTRAMLLTGVDHHKAGLGAMAELVASNQRDKPGYEGYLNHKVITLADYLKEAGYNTYLSGKWHLGGGAETNPAARGFDKSFALIDGAGGHFDNTGQTPFKPVATYFENGEKVNLPEDFFSTKFYTDKMLDYIGQSQDDGKPFFGYLAYTAPHWPLQAPEELVAKYADRYRGGYEQLLVDRLTRMKSLGLIPEDVEYSHNHPGVRAWNQLTEDQKKIESKKMAIYAAMVEGLDTQIGRLLAALNNSGQLENTFIFFMSDNGADGLDLENREPWASWLKENFDNSYENIGRRGSFVSYGPAWALAASAPFKIHKGFVSEGGTRVAAIANYPGISRGHQANINSSYLTVKDVTPTILEIVGVERISPKKNNGKEKITGKSFKGLLNGNPESLHPNSEAIGWELNNRRALVRGKWKILWVEKPFGTGDWQLYDLSEDLAESNDLSSKYPGMREEMIGLWEEYSRENGVVLKEEGATSRLMSGH